MPKSPEEFKKYLKEARREDGFKTIQEQEFVPTPDSIDDPIPPIDDEHIIIASAVIKGRRRVSVSLPIQGPTPINSITQRQQVFTHNENLGKQQILPIPADKADDINRLPHTSITTARHQSDHETRHLFRQRPKSSKTIGYTRESRLTPQRKG